MRHRDKNRTLGRVKEQRMSLMRSLADSLVLHSSIKTTVPKAKELKKYIEPLVTKARKGTLAERRRIQSFLYTDEAVEKMMAEIGPRYRERKGGYTRIIKMAPRSNDGAEVAVIEFV